MANPKLKNGYMSVANELVEKFASISISGSEMRIVWALWRKTWCWKDGDRHKDWDKVSISQFEKMTTMKRPNVSEAIKSLVVKRLLLRSEKGYRFNQNYDEWVVVKRLPPVVKSIQSSSQTTTEGSSQTYDYKRKRKETIQKKEEGNPIGLQATQWNELIDSFKEINPSYTDFYKNKTERGALEVMSTQWGYDKLLRTIKELPKIIGLPYAPRITRPSELRRDIGKLLAFVSQEKSKNTNLII